MSCLVTDNQIYRYQRDGVIFLKNFFDRRWLEILDQGIEENLRRPSHRTETYVNDPANGDYFFFDARILGEVGAYDDLMMNSPMAEAVAQFMGSSQAILFYITVFVRSPGTHSRTPWHQDQSSWSADGKQACSMWFALDEIPRDTALEFVRGSHQWATEYQRPDFFLSHYEDDDRSILPAFPDIEAHRDNYDILSWDMEPGDCVVFHGMTAHGGSGNLPPGLGRRTVSVQWLGDDARFQRVPGGDDPRISEELKRHGIKQGDPMICDMCPVAWPRN